MQHRIWKKPSQNSNAKEGRNSILVYSRLIIALMRWYRVLAHVISLPLGLSLLFDHISWVVKSLARSSMLGCSMFRGVEECLDVVMYMWRR